MIEVTPTLKIDKREIQLDFIRAAGPGGYNVNKVATGSGCKVEGSGTFNPLTR